MQEPVQAITAGAEADAVIETTSSESGFGDALAMIRPRGTVVLVGVCTKPSSVHLRKITGNEINLNGSMCYRHSGRLTDFDVTIDLIASGKVDPVRIVTDRVALDEISEAFRITDDKRAGPVKVNIVH